MTEKQLLNLLSKMTLEEKLCQLTQAEPRNITDKMSETVNPEADKKGIAREQYYALGSVISYVPRAADIRKVQTDYLKNSRLKIPLLVMSDVVHGKETIFPIPLALGCSFNTDLVKGVCETAAEEAVCSGVHTVFAPACDLSRDPRWGRVMESYGEDPFLNARMAAASVKGFQGECKNIDERHLSSCVKHYLGYGACVGGRDYDSCEISDNELLNYYIKPFAAASKAGVSMAMTSFNTLNGVPMTVNADMLKILREDLGFENGIIITDYNSLAECREHGIAEDDSALAQLAFNSTVDIEMMSTVMLKKGKQLADSGQISEKIIDESVMRVLRLKNRLGLFENPYRGISEEKESFFIDNSAQREKSRKAAIECAVLLKNNGALPINKNEKIGLAGPFALSDEVSGEWAFSMLKAHNISLCEGLENNKLDIILSNTDNIRRVKGETDLSKTDIPYPNDISNFSVCDKIILAIGEHMGDTGEAASRHTISLSPNQIELVKKASMLGKPLIAVIFSGRPLDLSPINDLCDAILYGWYLGCEAGNALADLLTGEANPSGKLAMSLPRNVGQIPIYYNRLNTGRPKTADNIFGSGYTDIQNDPLYAFGHGLSYCNFEYSALKINDRNITVKVKNNSDREGFEVVQLYIRDLYAKIARPIMELKGFKKMNFKPFEEKQISFTLTDEILSYFYGGKNIFEKGKFDIIIGGSSKNFLSERIEII